MKKYKKNIFRSIIPSLFLIIILSGCNDDCKDLEANASFEISATPTVGEPFTITMSGDNEFVTIFLGDTTENDVIRTQGNIGLSFSGSSYTVQGALNTYHKAGTYTITVEARSYCSNGEEEFFDKKTMVVDVEDKRTSFESFDLRFTDAYHVSGVIENDSIVTFTYASARAIDSLVPIFKTVSSEIEVYIGTTQLVSGETAIDFTSSPDIRIVAPNGDENTLITKFVSFPGSSDVTLYDMSSIRTPLDDSISVVGDTVYYFMPWGREEYGTYSSTYVFDLEAIYWSIPPTAAGIYVNGNLRGKPGKPVYEDTLRMKERLVFMIEAENGDIGTYYPKPVYGQPIESMVFESFDPPVHGYITDTAVTVKFLVGSDLSELSPTITSLGNKASFEISSPDTSYEYIQDLFPKKVQPVIDLSDYTEYDITMIGWDASFGVKNMKLYIEFVGK